MFGRAMGYVALGPIVVIGVWFFSDSGDHAPTAPPATTVSYPTELPCDKITDDLDRSDCYDDQTQKDGEW